MKTRNGRLTAIGWLPLLAVAWATHPTALGQVRRPGQARHESILRGDGQVAYGKVGGDPRSGFRFEPLVGEPAVPLEKAGVVSFDGPGADAGSGFPPMRVLLGLDQQISGKLGLVDDRAIRLDDGPGGATVNVLRGGALAVSQRPGEALVLQDGFDSLDGRRWSHVGSPSIVDQPRVAGSGSLALPAGGSAVTCRLVEPVASGRLEVVFHDSGRIVAGQQWFVDLLFRGVAGDESVRLLIDWSEESLAVQSTGGRSLAVQRLARKPGWHRLGVRFGAETELAVDGDELAHGRGPSGPLIEIRLANQTTGNAESPKDSVVLFDDLRLVRLAEPVGGLEVVPQVDDVRLVDGDQIFGRLKSADPDSVKIRVDGADVGLPWTDVASLHFRRAPEPGRPIEGLLVRVEWRSAPGNDPRDLDQVEGALLGLTESAITVATAYSGNLTIPRDRLRRLRVLGQGMRLILDPTAHHLGNNDSSKDTLPLSPPSPEGGSLELNFPLDKVPNGPAWLVLDVVQVEGEATSLKFGKEIKEGELRTNVKLNDKPVDYLNRHITTRNETPERIRIPIPNGLLHPGQNKLRFDQIPMTTKPEELDDIGILTIALEFSGASG